jgi:molecular chaperone GrpE
VLAHSENAESVAESLKIVYEHLKGILRTQGVEQIEAAGERFDPTMHEAIVQRAEPGKEDGVVLEELQKGYRMNGRVIRASRVVVNKAAEEPGLDEIGQDETKDTQ